MTEDMRAEHGDAETVEGVAPPIQASDPAEGADSPQSEPAGESVGVEPVPAEPAGDAEVDSVEPAPSGPAPDEPVAAAPASIEAEPEAAMAGPIPDDPVVADSTPAEPAADPVELTRPNRRPR